MTCAPAYCFDIPQKNTGEPLTPDQKTSVQDAIDGIFYGHPTSITYTDAHGNVKTASAMAIGRRLQGELGNGSIQQETLNNDAHAWEYNQEINIEDGFLNAAGSSGMNLVYLQEILIHEWVHKQQGDHSAPTRCTTCDANEVEATDAELTYKDSMHVSPQDPERLWSYWLLNKYWYNYINGRWKDIIGRMSCQGLLVEVRQEDDPDHDHCRSYNLGDQSCTDRDLDPLECSDMRVYENYFPNGNGLLLLCGFVPGAGGCLQALELSDSSIVGEFSTQAFTQYFYSMERVEATNSYFIVDTSTTQVYSMGDTNSDLLPDLITGTYASVSTFPQLAGMRSVEAAVHPVFGFGLIVNNESARYTHLIQPYDSRWFLVDSNGDNQADQCWPVRRCEFIQVTPQIRSEPIAGDNFVSVFGTWNHEVGVYTTNEAGEVLFDLLGTVLFEDSVQYAMELARPLLAGEYIIPQDLVNGERSGCPTQVIFPPPTALVIGYDPEFGMLQLTWEAVPGALTYALHASDDGVEFYDTGIRSGTNQLEIPLPPMEIQFYRVTAEP
jgi:hypothetical protein